MSILLLTFFFSFFLPFQFNGKVLKVHMNVREVAWHPQIIWLHLAVPTLKAEVYLSLVPLLYPHNPCLAKFSGTWWYHLHNLGFDLLLNISVIKNRKGAKKRFLIYSH